MRVLVSISELFLSHGYVLELTVCLMAVAWRDERRRHLGSRLLGVVAIALVLSVLAGTVGGPINVALVRWTALFGWSLLALKLCLHLTFSRALFVVVAGAVVQHAAFRGARTVVDGFVAITSSGVGVGRGLYAVVFCLCVVLLWPLIRRHYQRGRVDDFHLLLLLAVSAGVMLCINVFSTLFQVSGVQVLSQPAAYFAFTLADLTYSAFVLGLLAQIIQRREAELDRRLTQALMVEQRKQLEHTRDTVEFINVTAHDLRRLLSSMDEGVRPAHSAHLARLIASYDARVRTGNDTVDIVLTHRSMQCEQRGIQLERIVDASALDRLTPDDLYSLFDNLLGNAIRAVSKLPDPTRRAIHLVVRRRVGLAVIHCENPVDAPVEFVDGLPISTKASRTAHGFGTRSIRRVARNYGGEATMSVSGGNFCVDVVIPLEADRK